MSLNNNNKPSPFVILAILDGWGIAPEGPGNAIKLANTPNFDKFWATYPHTQLRASGDAVGLPRDEDGNTETGHLNLGAGRIVYQDLARINMSIADGAFFDNKVINEAFEHAEKNNSKLHVMGLIGAGGVHSNIEHLFAIIKIASIRKFQRLFIHVFTDGRDSPPSSALTYIARLNEVLSAEKVGTIASVMGRYWAMDRDQRWDRTARAYFCLTRGDQKRAVSAEDCINTSYKNGTTDEFIEPTNIVDENGIPKALIQDNDSVIFFNFRIDRPRQLSRAFVIKDLARLYQDWGFDPYAVEYKQTHIPEPEQPPIVIHRGEKLKNLSFVTMTEYGKPLVSEGAKVAFPPEQVGMTLGRVISSYNLKQLRVAESEKERFVTYYFNGQVESSEIGEDRVIIPSPDMATYDLDPKMSAYQTTEKLIQKVKETGAYKFILINYANPDMVAHTGNLEATKKACEVVDECLGKLEKFTTSVGGTLLITADHGNAEEIINLKTGEVDTEHSNFPVPFIAISKNLLGKPPNLQSGILADVAPTIIKLLGLEKPANMTGRNLLENY